MQTLCKQFPAQQIQILFWNFLELKKFFFCD